MTTAAKGKPRTWRQWCRWRAATWVPRLVSPLFESTLWRIPPTHGIALTFDDGPNQAGTDTLLEVLAQHAVPATFFLLGRNAAADPGRVRALVSAGHQVGNHTWNHPDAWRTPRNAYLEELTRTTDTLEQISGQQVLWFRPPYGHISLPAIAWCRAHGQRPVLWDLAPPDYRRGCGATELRQALDVDVRPGSIVCLHDNPDSAHVTPQVLGEWLAHQRQRGATFSPLPAALAWNRPKLAASDSHA